MELLWRVCGIFLLPLTALLAFLLSATFGKPSLLPSNVEISNWATIVVALFGLVLSVFWLMSCHRSLEIRSIVDNSVGVC